MGRKTVFAVPLLLFLVLEAVLCLKTEHCSKPLGMKSDRILDKHITASSYYDKAVSAHHGRAHLERGSGAWCPRKAVHNDETEFLEINLLSPHVLTKVEVQGRFGNGQGKEYAEKYKLQYWREEFEHWITYKTGRGEEIFEGNSNTYLAKSTQLNPPVVVSRLRFVPYSDHPRTVCMRVEIYGCSYTDGLLSYSMTDGDVRGKDGGLKDVTYDGLTQVTSDGMSSQTWLSGGLGQLTDGEIGHTNFLVDSIGEGRGYEWVGWKNNSRGTNPVEIIFKFDGLRNFSTLQIYVNNVFTRDTMIFSKVRISFSAEGEMYTSSALIEFRPEPDRIFEKARWVTIDLKESKGRFVKLELYFSIKWIMVSEIQFESELCNCNVTDDDLYADTFDNFENDEDLISGSNRSSGLLLGGLITLAVVFGVFIVLGVYYYRNYFSKAKPKNQCLTANPMDSRKVSMKMKDLHINMNLSPTTNGYSRAKGKLYGRVHMEEEVAAMYQEPYKGPIHNPGYYTLNTSDTPSDAPIIKCVQDDSVDYAVPDLNMTPPPPFSEIYTPPPPVPLSRPPNTSRVVRETPPMPRIPTIPPPPDQQYYAAPNLCLASNIQGVTGTVIYSVIDTNLIQKEVAVSEIPKHRIHYLENLGEGVFGSVQLCEIDTISQNSGTLKTMTVNKKLAAVKILKPNASEAAVEHFRAEARILSRLNDPNIVKLLGVVSRPEPLAIALEYMEHGDLYQFLRRHICDGISIRLPTLPNNPGESPPILSYGALIYISTQVASGMKYLEDLSIVHRDLATRNCLVGRYLTIKISDFGMCRTLYSNDYYRVEGRTMLPIRWMAWESILQGRFTIKSDVWAFGVTLWEILTMARRKPFDELSDEGVIENISHCFHGDDSEMMFLPHPPVCPREMYDMLRACWRSSDRQRPPFWEILMFLQRKNLGYTLDYSEDELAEEE